MQLIDNAYAAPKASPIPSIRFSSGLDFNPRIEFPNVGHFPNAKPQRSRPIDPPRHPCEYCIVVADRSLHPKLPLTLMAFVVNFCHSDSRSKRPTCGAFLFPQNKLLKLTPALPAGCTLLTQINFRKSSVTRLKSILCRLLQKQWGRYAFHAPFFRA